MAVGIFAGIPVSDFQGAVGWYERLLGAEPTFYPNDLEAVWRLAEDRYVYIIQDAERAGGAVSMIWVDDPRSEVARISDLGLDPVAIEKHSHVWKYVSTAPTGTRLESAGTSRRSSEPARLFRSAALHCACGRTVVGVVLTSPESIPPTWTLPCGGEGGRGWRWLTVRVSLARFSLDVSGQASPRAAHAVALTTMGVAGKRRRHSLTKPARASASRVAT